MFLVEKTSNGILTREVFKNPFLELPIDDNDLKIRKYHGPYMKVYFPDGSEKVANSFFKFTSSGLKLCIYSLDLDFVSIGPSELKDSFYTCFSYVSFYPAILIFKGSEKAICSCYSKKRVLIGSTGREDIVLPELEGISCVMYLKNESLSFSSEGSDKIFVDAHAVSGLIEVDYGSVISLPKDIRIVVVDSENSLQECLKNEDSTLPSKFTFSSVEYPCLVGNNSLIRPPRVLLQPGMSLTIGRESFNDIWIPAPHISRTHCTIKISDDASYFEIEDSSTNGTMVNDRILKRGEQVKIDPVFTIVDLGKDFKLAVCYSEKDEAVFKNRKREEVSFENDNFKIEESVLHNKSSNILTLGPKKWLFRICVIILVMLLIGLLVWNFHL
ncbi:MAG: FHA domain-containing protein [Deltaproteobacteria bacterium]|nr:FHA domain-containing protein [Deltaproteobacteria bacterium]